MFDIETEIKNWKLSLTQNDALGGEESLELETHLRESISELHKNGLSKREAFMIGVDRLGHPMELEAEYCKVNASGQWRNRVFWMLTGHIAFAVCGAVISAMAMVAGTGGAISGIGGTATGATMLLVVALGWICAIAALYHQTRNSNSDWSPSRLRWGILAVALLLISPLLTASGNLVRTRLTDIADIGQSALVFSLGAWAIHFGVCIACLVLIRKLSQAKQPTYAYTANR